MSSPRLIIKQQGVIFETSLIQVGYRSEFRTHLGRVQLFYGNKSGLPMTSFSSKVIFSEVSPTTNASPLNLDLRPAPTSIEANKQVPQVLNIECMSDFAEVPHIFVTYAYVPLSLTFFTPQRSVVGGQLVLPSLIWQPYSLLSCATFTQGDLVRRHQWNGFLANRGYPQTRRRCIYWLCSSGQACPI